MAQAPPALIIRPPGREITACKLPPLSRPSRHGLAQTGTIPSGVPWTPTLMAKDGLAAIIWSLTIQRIAPLYPTRLSGVLFFTMHSSSSINSPHLLITSSGIVTCLRTKVVMERTPSGPLPG
uniref:Uncharacterized protein n=1 Tax=Branchiostoma floridae TaxID=7739 RepID=C3YXX7_BRAFL|eukprot:XP_002598924.1 hypothetical protein BRAFLDRAFT_79855 [Branchiostoma floridae]